MNENTELKLDTITCGDCMEWLKTLPDGCADLVLTDPPYNIGKAAWDKVDNYVSWLCDVFDECHRVAKDNATLIWWHNDLQQIAALMCELERRGRWTYNCHLVCKKQNHREIAWKRPSEKNTIRSWFNIAEMAMVYVNGKTLGSSKTGLQKVYATPEFSASIRAYFWGEMERAGLDERGLTELLKAWSGESGRMVWHYLYPEQFEIPTRKKYEGFFQAELRRVTGIPDLFPREFEALRGEFEALRGEFEALRGEFEALREVHNLDSNHCNVWDWVAVNNSKLHPCRKPVDLLRRLVRTHSNPGSLVIDPFAGSGSTGEAAVAEHRRFAGCERDQKYAEIARHQIAAVVPDFAEFTRPQRRKLASERVDAGGLFRCADTESLWARRGN